ncbi:ferric reductase-like transmembrane domain-containing protein [Pseudomonas sp. H9]|uniref:ferric reductase-like transmembrane domain-containing protein n=1 Tax=Pseudomonas sp. H9 TaxID=483968 RepID=UPI001057B753|nr:ferric reductase-like transmembrane domain-containing protein [Pseudomonas sp. H9]TDF80237.1 ferric reductase like transmembrane component [Pseudomonas sp. H9]
MLAFILRLTALYILPFALLFILSAKPGVNPAWDFANAAGFFSGLLLVSLFLYSGRPQARPYYDGKFFMNLHRDLGFAATLLLAVHIGVLLVSEPLVINYLKPSATWPMLSGTLATLLLIFLVPTSLPSVRQKIWRNHQQFKTWHYGLCALMLILMSVHMISAGFYTAEPWKALLWTAITAAAIFKPLLPRPSLARGNGSRRRNTAIFASRLSMGVMLFVLALAIGFSLLANSDLPL